MGEVQQINSVDFNVSPVETLFVRAATARILLSYVVLFPRRSFYRLYFTISFVTLTLPNP